MKGQSRPCAFARIVRVSRTLSAGNGNLHAITSAYALVREVLN